MIPPELADADLVIGLCDRFHCLPSQLEQESGDLIRMLRIHQLGHPEKDEPEEEFEEEE